MWWIQLCDMTTIMVIARLMGLGSDHEGVDTVIDMTIQKWSQELGL
jgi:hypothetical protein